MNEQVTKLLLPDNATDIVIFVHGFGVRWDSRGLFTDIQRSLATSWGTVMFDFYNITGEDVYITSVDQQIEKLKTIIASLKVSNPESKLHIVAHSKGCVITALVRPNVTGEVIFLSPPESFGTKIENYFRRYPGAQTDETELTVPRKDGTTTHIPLDFFKQTAKIQAEGVLLDYSKMHHIHLLQTTQDEVLGETNYSTLLNNEAIKITKYRADHNFTQRNREILVDYIRKTLGL